MRLPQRHRTDTDGHPPLRMQRLNTTLHAVHVIWHSRRRSPVPGPLPRPWHPNVAPKAKQARHRYWSTIADLSILGEVTTAAHPMHSSWVARWTHGLAAKFSDLGRFPVEALARFPGRYDKGRGRSPVLCRIRQNPIARGLSIDDYFRLAVPLPRAIDDRPAEEVQSPARVPSVAEVRPSKSTTHPHRYQGTHR